MGCSRVKKILYFCNISNDRYRVQGLNLIAHYYTVQRMEAEKSTRGKGIDDLGVFIVEFYSLFDLCSQFTYRTRDYYN